MQYYQCQTIRFRQTISTSHTMYEVENSIKTNVKNNRKCIVEVLELAITFDSMTHIELLNVLNNFGVRKTH